MPSPSFVEGGDDAYEMGDAVFAEREDEKPIGKENNKPSQVMVTPSRHDPNPAFNYFDFRQRQHLGPKEEFQYAKSSHRSHSADS